VTDDYDAIVIGGGHNGLVTAAYLGKAGLKTVVLERRGEPGGALATTAGDGVSVPALAHSVGRLRPSVATDLGLYDRGLELIQPPVRVFAPGLEKPPLTLWGDIARTVAELRRVSPADAAAYPAFDERVRSLAGLFATLEETTPPDLAHLSLADALDCLPLLRAFARLSDQDGRTLLRVLPMPVADFVAEAFSNDALCSVLATRGIQYAAMGPWSAGTTAVLLADSSGSDRGAAGHVVFARGGPRTLVGALEDAARSWGGAVRLGAEVAAITTSGERAVGVALDSGEEIAAPIVVSGADPKRTLRLVDPVVLGPELRWRADNIRMPGVVAKVNLVLSALPRFDGADGSIERLQGRIVVAPGIDALERAFDASKYGRVSESPYLDATIPTLADPSLAPARRHVMSVIAQYAPYELRDADWDSEREGLGDLVLKTLEAYAPGIADLTVARDVVTPLDLERDFALSGGHPLHGEPALDQFFAWRPLLGHAGYRFGIDGLYLCGAGAHPGGGITGAPGANAAREIIRDLKRRRRTRGG
jgi:phytoene dehydrogenase-like protein